MNRHTALIRIRASIGALSPCGWSLRRVQRAVVVSLLVSFGALVHGAPALAADSASTVTTTLTMGAPGDEGKITFTVIKTDGTVVKGEIEIKKDPVTGKLPDAAKKKDDLRAALEAKGISVADEGDNKISFVSKGSSIVDGTQQDLKKEMAAAFRRGAIDYALEEGFASLAGVDAGGGEAVYKGGFGFTSGLLGDVFVSSELAFSELGGSSVESLLTAMFLELQGELALVSAGLEEMLQLDLVTHSINMVLTGGDTSPVLLNGTTDISVLTSLESAVPEPGTIVLVVASIPALILFRRRGRARFFASMSEDFTGLLSSYPVVSE